ncbi:MAG: hypothetical protein NZZ41_03495 [Candidatus Dojkabacteria bacterium]|nr:hypothetical protein [Candidatus Dojkabacteria bacterium]
MSIVFLLDNYEREETHAALVRLAMYDKLELMFAVLSKRLWVVLLDIDPSNGHSDKTIGMAPPSWLICDLLSNEHSELWCRLRRIVEHCSRKKDLGNGTSVLFIGQDRFLCIELPNPVVVFKPEKMDIQGLDRAFNGRKETLELALMKELRNELLKLVKSEDFFRIQDGINNVICTLIIMLLQKVLEEHIDVLHILQAIKPLRQFFLLLNIVAKI